MNINKDKIQSNRYFGNSYFFANIYHCVQKSRNKWTNFSELAQKFLSQKNMIKKQRFFSPVSAISANHKSTCSLLFRVLLCLAQYINCDYLLLGAKLSDSLLEKILFTVDERYYLRAVGRVNYYSRASSQSCFSLHTSSKSSLRLVAFLRLTSSLFRIFEHKATYCLIVFTRRMRLS